MFLRLLLLITRLSSLREGVCAAVKSWPVLSNVWGRHKPANKTRWCSRVLVIWIALFSLQSVASVIESTQSEILPHSDLHHSLGNDLERSVDVEQQALPDQPADQHSDQDCDNCCHCHGGHFSHMSMPRPLAVIPYIAPQAITHQSALSILLLQQQRPPITRR